LNDEFWLSFFCSDSFLFDALNLGEFYDVFNTSSSFYVEIKSIILLAIRNALLFIVSF